MSGQPGALLQSLVVSKAQRVPLPTIQFPAAVAAPHLGAFAPQELQLNGSAPQWRRQYASGAGGLFAIALGVWAYCAERRRSAVAGGVLRIGEAPGEVFAGGGSRDVASSTHQSCVRMDEHGNWVSTITMGEQSFVVR